MGDTRGCLRGNECKYLHVSSKKGENVKQNKNCHNEGERIDDTSDKTNEKKDDVLIDSLKKEEDLKTRN